MASSKNGIDKIRPIEMAKCKTNSPPSAEGLNCVPSFDPSLCNDDLKPLQSQHWNTYNIFAVWMTDVHSVAGYLTAGSLFALRLSGWQVTGVPYPVINRAIFGIRGANVPALLRGSIAIAWYGVQTFLASRALIVVLLKFFPSLVFLHNSHGFVGLSPLGWCSFGIMSLAQAVLFWMGMEAIRKFIDWAGPAVYVAMLLLALYLVANAGVRNLSLNFSGDPLPFVDSLPSMFSAVALVVSYFSGPMLNFGDFSRYAKSWKAVKLGNFLGLPVNFIFFSLLTVLITSATLPVFGRLITDPIEVVEQIGNRSSSDWVGLTVVSVGGATFVIATVGINIVANFISPAFDFSNLAPNHISWRGGGMITAIASVLLTPWNWYNNPEAIHFALGILGALIGPLHGILVSGYFIASKQKVWVPDLYSSDVDGRYWFSNGFNPNALGATAIGGALAIATVILPKISTAFGSLHLFSWFVGCFFGFGSFTILEWANPKINLTGNLGGATDGQKQK
ncbi:hypothetical protein niasHS_005860 [Heterodera schachtii]|uniref:Uncharacterized protein n=1 Tax=Heterodera schachtii TaxID=97005 RepID=A0ABD2JRU6_HETSC